MCEFLSPSVALHKAIRELSYQENEGKTDKQKGRYTVSSVHSDVTEKKEKERGNGRKKRKSKKKTIIPSREFAHFCVFYSNKSRADAEQKLSATSASTTCDDPIPITILAKPDLPATTFAQPSWSI